MAHSTYGLAKGKHGLSAIAIIATAAIILIIASAYILTKDDTIIPIFLDEETKSSITPELKQPNGQITTSDTSAIPLSLSYWKYADEDTPTEGDEIRFKVVITNSPDQTTPIDVVVSASNIGEGEGGETNPTYTGIEVCPGGESADGKELCDVCEDPLYNFDFCTAHHLEIGDSIELRTDWLDLETLCPEADCPEYTDPEGEFIDKIVGIKAYAKGTNNLYVEEIPLDLDFHIAANPPETTTTLDTSTSTTTTASGSTTTSSTTSSSTTLTTTTTPPTTTTIEGMPGEYFPSIDEPYCWNELYPPNQVGAVPGKCLVGAPPVDHSDIRADRALLNWLVPYDYDAAGICQYSAGGYVNDDDICFFWFRGQDGAPDEGVWMTGDMQVTTERFNMDAYNYHAWGAAYTGAPDYWGTAIVPPENPTTTLLTTTTMPTTTTSSTSTTSTSTSTLTTTTIWYEYYTIPPGVGNAVYITTPPDTDVQGNGEYVLRNWFSGCNTDTYEPFAYPVTDDGRFFCARSISYWYGTQFYACGGPEGRDDPYGPYPDTPTCEDNDGSSECYNVVGDHTYLVGSAPVGCTQTFRVPVTSPPSPPAFTVTWGGAQT